MYRRTLKVVCDLLIRDRLFFSDREQRELVFGFVWHQQHRMPDVYRPVFVLVTVVFFLHGLLRHGQLLHRLEPRRCNQMLSKWRDSPFAVCRDWVLYLEAMLTFAGISTQTHMEGLSGDLRRK